jgi:hypothetical protein
LAAQRGDCDPGCGGDGCDLPGCDLPGPKDLDCCDLVDCCDLPERQQRERKRSDKNARLPPRRQPRDDSTNDTRR